MSSGHPHRRGELVASSRARCRHVGPSPQAWGTRPSVGAHHDRHRAIPTGVGNSPSAPITRGTASGHPHRRGELGARLTVTRGEAGPSPQAWGTHRPATPPAPRPRAIPTGVGNSSTGMLTPAPATGHPHRRGELMHLEGNIIPHTGPSPQAWGTLVRAHETIAERRAIPTGVGNSPHQSPAARRQPGHPHRRGELMLKLMAAYSAFGPSPQAWGTLPDDNRVYPPLRAIPTGVGNSRRPTGRIRSSPGHPHRRGELRTGSPYAAVNGGPSPQAWGTRADTPAPQRPRRAIPTGVGNSDLYGGRL